MVQTVRKAKVRTVPKLRGLITPAKDDDFATGAVISVVDEQACKEVSCASFTLRARVGLRFKELWGDLTLPNGTRVRIPVEVRTVTRR